MGCVARMLCVFPFNAAGCLAPVGHILRPSAEVFEVLEPSLAQQTKQAGKTPS